MGMLKYHTGPQPDRTPQEDKPWFGGGPFESGGVRCGNSYRIEIPNRAPPDSGLGSGEVFQWTPRMKLKSIQRGGVPIQRLENFRSEN